MTAPPLVASGSGTPTGSTVAGKRPSPPRPSSPLCPDTDPPSWLWHGYHCRLDKTLRSRYDITCADYWRLFHAQRGLCAVCGRPPEEWRLVPDHNHDTGAVDGLTHHRCNWPISQRVRRYLANPPGRDLGLVVPPEKLADLERRAAQARARRREGAGRRKRVAASNGAYDRATRRALEQTTDQGG